MQRLLQASTRASLRARPARREGSTAQSSVLAAASEPDAPASVPLSATSALRLSPLQQQDASAYQPDQHSQGSAASESRSPIQLSLGDLSCVPCQAPPVQRCTGREAYTGGSAVSRQHLLSPHSVCSGRQAYASAAEALAAPPQQLLAVRQASNERPALSAQRHARSPRKRAAIIARLASSLGARGYVTESATAEGLAAQDRTCREVTDEMISLVEQGRADKAITLFNPDFLLKEGGWEGAFLCDALLRACAALGEVQLMLLTVQTMHALGIPVGYVAHGCVLTGLGRAGKLEDAFQYLSQEVPIEAQTPGMYNSLLEAALRASDTQMANRLLDMMDDAGVAPDSRTASAALRVAGSSKAAGAVHIVWAKLQPELKQHVAVHAAYVDALCMAAGVPEALSALKKMLDLFAAQHGQMGSHMQQPGHFPDVPASHPAPEIRLLGPSVTPDSSSMGLKGFPYSITPSPQPFSPSQGGASEAYLQSSGQGTSQQPYSAMAAEPQLLPSGVPLQLRRLERSFESEVEQSSVAIRAAQAACHQVLNAAAKARQSGVPQKVLQAMHQAGVEADAAIYNSIMRQQAAAGSGPAVLEGTLADMEAHGVQPDRRSLFLLLREHSRRGDLASAMIVMRRMAQLDIAPDRFTYNALLEAHTAAEDLEGVARVYKAMLTRGIRPDICTFVALFQALKSSKESAGFMQSNAEQASWLQRMRGSAYVAPQELLAFWRSDFEASGLQHTPASFTALVQALGQTQQIEEMLQVLAGAWAARAAQRPSIYACNSAIGACARAGRLDDALRLCSTMEQQGLRADTYTYSLLMNGFAHARRPDMAFKLFDQMHERGVKPNVYIYNALIKAQASTGDLIEALQLLDVMEEAGVRPDRATWRILLSQSRYLGRPDVAELVEARMQGKIQQWPQQLLNERGPAYFEQLAHGQITSARQETSAAQPFGFEDGEEDEDDDMFGGPRF